MINKLKNKMLIGGALLGVIGATALAGGVANADPMRDGRRFDNAPAIRVHRNHLHRHHNHRFGVRRDCR